MIIRQVPLARIKPNPWQTRTQEDPKQVEQVAQSISEVGLLQVPVGRPDPAKPEGVQLAFGHTRLEAFHVLAKKDPQYREMPVDVRKLDDREMAELAIRENRERKDLSPIEEAQAIRQYMDAFEPDVKKVAKLFGYEPASIRSKLRLLRLPKGVQKHVHSGAIPERSARKFQALAYVDPKAAEELAAAVASDEAETEETIQERLLETLRKRSRELHSPWDHDQALGKFWPLAHRFGRLAVPGNLAAEALTGVVKKGQESKIAKLILGRFVQGQDAMTQVRLFGENPEAVERIEHLREPPTCPACPFYQVLSGHGFCGFKACLTLKRRTWVARQQAKAAKSEKTAWAGVYDRKADGPAVRASYYGQGITQEGLAKAVKAKSKDVRVRLMSSPEYRPDELTGSAWAEFVVVGEAAKKATAAAKKGRYNPEAQEKRWAEERKHEQEAEVALGSVVRHFASMYAALTDWKLTERIMLALAEVQFGRKKDSLFDGDEPNATEKVRLALAQEYLATSLLERWFGRQEQIKPLPKVLDRIEGVAKQFGVHLPASWREEAEKMVASHGQAEVGGKAEAESEDEEDDQEEVDEGVELESESEAEG